MGINLVIEEREILNQASDALCRYIRKKFTWLGIYNKASSEPSLCGTGVWIKIGSHYFIATAEHVLKKGDICVAPPPPLIQEEPHRIVPIRIGKNKDLDIAYVEVKESCVFELQIDPFGLENLSDPTNRLSGLAHVAGFPTQLIESSEVEVGRNLEVCAVFLSSVPIYPTNNHPELGDVEYPSSSTRPSICFRNQSYFRKPLIQKGIESSGPH